MTSASELFYSRRSRLGRSDDAQDLSFESSSSDLRLNYCFVRRHRHRDRENRRRDFSEGCHRRWRSQHLSRSLLSEHATVRLEPPSSPPTPRNSIGADTVSSIRNPSNERLPGAVLLARERLVERLRGASLSGDRGISRATPSTSQGQTVAGNNSLTVRVGIIEPVTSPALSARGLHSLDMTADTQSPRLPQETYRKKPSGLTQENINHLQVVIFGGDEKHIECEESKSSWDCSICLELFVEGDELICLPCRHSFHASCLTPWIQICGDCPYCRTDIVMANR